MWAPTGYADHGMGGYAPILPPSAAPQTIQVQDYRLAPAHQFLAPTASPQQFRNIRGGRGRGRGRPDNRTQHPAVQNPGGKMPTGLAGPWQSGQQQPEISQAMVKSPVKTATKPANAKATSTPQQSLTGLFPVISKQPATKPKVILAGGAERTLETKGSIDIGAVKMKLLEGLMNVQADTYPKELLEKFSPLRCDLCVAKMNSTLQAKMHYNGKTHEKKVRMFMVNWSQANDEPAPKRAKIEEPDVETAVQAVPVRRTSPILPPETLREEEEDEPPAKEPKVQPLYCKYCDLSFTSALHAEQHYTGRNHQRVVSGKAPLKSGYFNTTTGKWQRTSDLRPLEDPTGRFGIGSNFLSEEQVKEANELTAEEKKGRFYCALCNVGATSQEQLDMHYHGAKHRKMLNNKQQSEEEAECVQPIAGTDDTLLKSVTKDMVNNSKVNNKDLSFYRTPSGKFYCQPCNITLNSESQFVSHTESKKHKVKQASQKPAMTLTGPKAEQWGDKSSSLWAA